MQEKQPTENSLNLKAEDIARIFKYYKQFTNKESLFYLSFEKISYKTCYCRYKKYFDKLCNIFQKVKIRPDAFLKFCVEELGILEPNKLLRIENFINYANNIKIFEQYKRIYDEFIKTANYVADECIKRDITPKEFIKYLIDNNKLAYEFISGDMSMYYIASIKNIHKICMFLDQNSRDEMSIILDVHDKLNQDTQEAFLRIKNTSVSPLKFSEQLIKQKIKG